MRQKLLSQPLAFHLLSGRQGTPHSSTGHCTRRCLLQARTPSKSYLAKGLALAAPEEPEDDEEDEDNEDSGEHTSPSPPKPKVRLLLLLILHA